MKRIFVPTKNGSDWQDLLAKPKLHWKKGASAMTAAAAWEDSGENLPTEITNELNSSGADALRDLELLAAIPEWEVSLDGGETASHTDVLAFARNKLGLCIIAVEAKVNEEFGPLLKEKRAEASAGQRERLDSLHKLLRVPHFDDVIRYKLLHRTASALLTASEFHARSAVMLAHCFGDKPNLRTDFEKFCSAMGAKQLSDGVHVASLFSDPSLYLVWCNGNRKYLEFELPGTPAFERI
jgi:hypothetical protein